jgi:hypothetical protein
MGGSNAEQQLFRPQAAVSLYSLTHAPDSPCRTGGTNCRAPVRICRAKELNLKDYFRFPPPEGPRLARVNG